MQRPPLEFAELLDDQATEASRVELEFRRVEATGTYRPSEEVLQRNRPNGNVTGFHLLTPFELSDGGVVLVRRGWVPRELDEPPVTEAAPPEGEVTLTGVLELPVEQPGGFFTPQDPDQGELERVFHTDTERLEGQISGELAPMVLRALPPEGTAQDRRASGTLPAPVDEPTLEGGNHLSYAFQWHAFAAIAVITYGAWLWTRHRRRTTDAATDGEPPSSSSAAAPSEHHRSRV